MTNIQDSEAVRQKVRDGYGENSPLGQRMLRDQIKQLRKLFRG